MGKTRTLANTVSAGGALDGGLAGANLIQTHTISGVATYDIENFSSTYDDYIIVVSSYAPSTPVPLGARFKVGGSYLSTGNYRQHCTKLSSAAATYTGVASAVLTYIRIAADVACFQASPNGNHHFTINAFNVNDTARYPNIFWQGACADSGAFYQVNGASEVTTTGALQGIRLMVGDGTSGTFNGVARVYGLKKALP